MNERVFDSGQAQIKRELAGEGARDCQNHSKKRFRERKDTRQYDVAGLSPRPRNSMYPAWREVG